MFKSVSKIFAILLIVTMNWSGLAAVFGTVAYFTDSEFSTDNIFQAGTLELYADGSVFSPTSLNYATSTSDIAINVHNQGSLDFIYQVKTATTTGDLCPMLNLSEKLDDDTYSSPVPVGDYVSSTSTLAALSTSNTLSLRASFAGGDFSQAVDKDCFISFYVDAWQTNLPKGQGFYDQEEIEAAPIGASDPEPVDPGPLMPGCTHNPNIVLNEFLPNPDGDDDAAMPGGEWVELYNADDHPVDLNGWLLYTSNNSYGMAIYSGNTNNGGTIIYPGGFLVVFRNGDPNFEIKNSGAEELRLFDRPIGEGVEDIDGVSYDAVAPEGKSFARIPDGIGEWIDPKPTPGGPNELTELEAANPQKLDATGVEAEAEVKTETEQTGQTGGAVLESDSGGSDANDGKEEILEESGDGASEGEQIADAGEESADEAEAPADEAEVPVVVEDSGNQESEQEAPAGNDSGGDGANIVAVEPVVAAAE